MLFLFNELELLFNRSNIWANMRNFKPTSIYYELHDPDRWLPFIADYEGNPSKINTAGAVTDLLEHGIFLY